jgi:proteasome lid subunit RPN8/RPN11
LIGRVFYDTETERNWVGILDVVTEDLSATYIQSQLITYRENFSELDAREKSASIQQDNLSPAILVGWYHTHPGTGVFATHTDVIHHRNSFTAPWHLSLIVDPIQNLYGVFAGPECYPVYKGIVVIPEGIKLA